MYPHHNAVKLPEPVQFCYYHSSCCSLRVESKQDRADSPEPPLALPHEYFSSQRNVDGDSTRPSASGLVFDDSRLGFPLLLEGSQLKLQFESLSLQPSLLHSSSLALRAKSCVGHIILRTKSLTFSPEYFSKRQEVTLRWISARLAWWCSSVDSTGHHADRQGNLATPKTATP